MFKLRVARVFTILMAVVLCVGLTLPAMAQSRVKLTVWGRDLPDTDPASAYIRTLVNGFQAANPDIELDYVALGDPGLNDKVKVVMATNTDLPDIFQSWGGSVMGGYADAGRLLDLTSELQSISTSVASARRCRGAARSTA